MVCLGNICRSPLAEGIMQHHVNNSGLDWIIDSAGTGGYHIGEQPHILSQKVSLQNGIAIGNQKARQFVPDDMVNFDRIYVMDEDNYADVQRLSGTLWNAKKTHYLLDVLYPGEKKGVPDPWYGTEKDFHSVFGLINKACEKIIENYQQQLP